ncbi:MAG: cupredoxin domain-containing protein [Candidatus Peregrinibacteria bacterium]
MNKIYSLTLTVLLLIPLAFLLFFEKQPEDTPPPQSSSSLSSVSSSAVSSNVEMKNGVQYIYIDAKGGYSPKKTVAKAGMPTKLVMKTNGTYDCSASFVLPSLNFQKILQQTGEEVIDLGTPTAGQPLDGLCGMGMYNFEVVFQ